MRSTKLVIPSALNTDNILSIGGKIEECGGYDSVEIILSEDKQYFSPFAILFIASKLKSIANKTNISVRNYHNHSYLKTMGFFKMFGVDIGLGVGQAAGNDAYNPICRIHRNDLYTSPGDRFYEVQDLIQRKADSISAIIARDEAGKSEFFNALSYSFREIFRNVFEHSESEELYYCVQYWGNSNKVELSICDQGVGIKKSLSQNPNFRSYTEKEAIEWCLMPGVSGKAHMHQASENWFNSGYGLYMTSRLARNGGNFVIASGSQAIYLTRKNKVVHRTNFRGTIIRMNISVGEIGSVQGRLKEFRDDASKILPTLKGVGNRPTSSVSVLLRRDFSDK